MSEVGSARVRWRKSTRCETHTCVEVAALPGHMAMRNSTVPDVQISFPAGAWADFVAGVRAGEFDRA